MTGEVAPLGHGNGAAPPDELRASYEDRDRVAELLRTAAGDGRLTAEELDERLEKALTARAYGEPEVPVILQVQVSGKVGSGHITARPPRRNFWQWLLRHPRPYAPAAP